MNATPKVTFALLSLAAALSSAPLSAQDKFADIATARYQLRSTLVEPAPPELPQKFLPVENDPQAAFRPMHTLSTGAELKAELAKLREQYAPYMKDVAPALPVSRASVPLDVFDWRIGTEADAGDFAAVERGEGEWTAVKIPHYGAPLGRAVTYYRKVVDLSPAMFRAGALFICFKGVDYKAEVYVNGTLAGTHTGFFAPFEFNIAKLARPGKNTILVKVSNDYTTTGNSLGGENVRGDKIYAATGPGYDEPVQGWHHCPAGMGIYQTCRIEARNPMHVNDLFVRPLPEENRAEAWVEINNFNETQENVKLVVSVYGQNFEQTILKEMEYIPSSTFIPGVGDLAKPTDNQAVRLKMGHGVNYLRIPLDMTGFRWWNPDTPWLYQLQVTVQDEQGNELDAAKQQFGMRSFTMDTVSVPRGRMYLNGEQIRLRGANTMGHLQQCVIRGDTAQLIDDILLAKLCNMNYLRLTQRPVQPEIYEWFDKLGLLNQTDLPLFGSLRRNLFSEAVKQAEEMERLVRKHPSTIMVSYINERFPNAEGQPQRSFGELAEYERLFTALDQAVLITNPDRVIKAGDGDYDPPSPGLPDSHCYNGWPRPRPGQDAPRLLAVRQTGVALCVRRVRFRRTRPRGGDVQILSERVAAREGGRKELDGEPDPAGADAPFPLYVVQHAGQPARLGAGELGPPGVGDQVHDRGLPPRRADGFVRDPPLYRRVSVGLDEDDHGCRPGAETGLLRLPQRARAADDFAAYRPLDVFSRRAGECRSVGLQRPQRCAAGLYAALPARKRGPGGVGPQRACRHSPERFPFPGIYRL
jgi:hypothetical protein